MFLMALDYTGNRVWIDDADKTQLYRCEICNKILKPRKGLIRSHHFYHFTPRGAGTYTGCSDKWHYDMSDWHREWQECFPESCREVVVSLKEKKHRADVLVENTVIEFQHSYLKPSEFAERNRFYKEAGYQIIWVFDVSNIENSNVKDQYCLDGLISTKECNIEENEITVYLQEKASSITQVKSVCGNSLFLLNPDISYSKKEFVENILKGSDCLYTKYPSKVEDTDELSIENKEKLNTIPELWNSNYKYMIVQNLGLPKKPYFKIWSNEGQMDRRNGKIQGYFTNPLEKKSTNRYWTSEKKYDIWDSEKRVWKLYLAYNISQGEIPEREKKQKEKIEKNRTIQEEIEKKREEERRRAEEIKIQREKYFEMLKDWKQALKENEEYDYRRHQQKEKEKRERQIEECYRTGEPLTKAPITISRVSKAICPKMQKYINEEKPKCRACIHCRSLNKQAEYPIQYILVCGYPL